MAAEDEFEEAVEEHDQDLYNESDSKDKTGQKKRSRRQKNYECQRRKCWYIVYFFQQYSTT